MITRQHTVAATAAALVVLTACGSSEDAATTSTARSTLTVFAAASLKATFTQLGASFEASHPGVTVTFNFAGSSDLVTQIQQGAPADVFASADTKNMDKATADSLISGAPVPFASNTLEIAVPPGNPAKVATLKDIINPAVKLVICAPEVPCGTAAEKVEAAAGLAFTPVSEESSVTDVLNKVATGQADAGLVYVTDVKGAAGKVEGVRFAESSAAVNTYPIGALAGTKNASLAKDFIALVTGAEGQKVLADAGFAKP